MKERWTNIVLVGVVAVAAIVVFRVSADSLALPGPSPAPTFTPARTPVLAPDALRVFPIGAIPADARFVMLGDPGDERLLLLDLVAKKITLAAHFEGTGAFVNGRLVESTSLGSGKIVVVNVRADGPDARVYVLKPETAEVRSFTTPRSDGPRLSPDGVTLAVSRNSADPDQHGLWLTNTNDGTSRRLIGDAGRRATRAVLWSSDGKRLSALVDLGAGKTQLVIVDPSGSVTPVPGDASDARWRGTDLLYWNVFASGPVARYDAAGGVAVSPAYPAPSGIIVDRAEVRPRSLDLAVREHEVTGTLRIVIYDAASGTTTVKLADASLVLSFWWSSDATRLYAWTIDNATTTVTDILTDTKAVTFCYRKKIEPPCQ